MARSNQLALRQARRGSVATSRARVTQRNIPKIVPRGRIAQKQVNLQQQQKAELEKTKKDVAEIIEKIEAGKISNLSQIPTQYRQYISVTRDQLNNISKYYSAKRYEDAYNAVMRHYQRGMLWAVAGYGEGLQRSIAKKLIKEGYAPSKLALEKERTERFEAIKSIKDGDIKGVKIVGNRIIGPGNKPISLTNALKKQAVDEINKTLPVGDKLITDKNYNITGISSGILRQSIPYTQKALDDYSMRVAGTGLTISKTKPSAKKIFEEAAKPITFKINGLDARYSGDKTQILINPGAGASNRSTIKIDVDATTVIPKSRTGLKVDLFFIDGNKVSKEKYIKDAKSISREFKNMYRDYTNDINDIKAKIRNNKNTEITIEQIREKIKKENPGLTTLQLSNKISDESTKQAVRNVRNLVKDVGELIIKTAATSIVGLGLSIPGGYSALKNDPVGTIKRLPSAVKTQVKNDINTVMSGDVLNILQLGVEYYTVGKLFQGVGAATKGAWRLGSKLSPKYVRMTGNKFVLRKPPASTFKVKGKTRYLKTRVQKPSFKRPFSSVADFLKGRKPGQFKKFTKNPGLILDAEKTVSKGAKPLSAQVTLAGKEVTAVNAAADQLTSWLRRRKIVRKPFNLNGLESKFPNGEASFPPRIKKILGKFDSGQKLTIKEFAEINIWLQKNIASNVTLLERSLYLDPESGLRISRIQLKPERTATIKDILKGNFRLWGNSGKPQVLIFENAKVAKFPKSLATVKRKLLKGQKLTVAETNQLITWQVKTGSGKFKPIGSTIYKGGIESEVTLAPGEMIRRLKQIGFTYIDRTKVGGKFVKIPPKKLTFVTAEVFKPSKTLLTQIKKANLGKLSKTALKSLESKLSKKLGRKIKIETPSLRNKVARATRRARPDVPVLRVKGTGLYVVVYRGMKVSKRKVKKKTKRRTTTKRRFVKKRPAIRRKVTIRKPTTRKRTTRKVTTRKYTPRLGRPKKKVTKRPSKRSPRKPSKIPPVRRPPKRPSGRRPSKTPTKKKPPTKLTSEKFKRKVLNKAQPVYYVVIKRRGKMIKLNPKPLIMKDAKDFLAYRLDNGLTRTAFFVPIGKTKNVVEPPKPIKGYFAKARKKIRPYKIRYGAKKRLLNGYIEKRKYFQDTRSEKRALALERERKKRIVKRKPIKRKIVRRKPIRKTKRSITPAQRKKMLANLRKARLTRIKKLRKKKRS